MTTNDAIWVLTPPLIGTAKPCLALAAALNLPYSQKIVTLKAPWSWLTPFGPAFKTSFLTQDSSPLIAPWPKLVIASGRPAIAPALWIKQQNAGQTKIVFVQTPPKKFATQFDLILSPTHDGFDAPNVQHINGTFAQLNAPQLKLEHHTWRPLFETLPQPRVAVLIGGTNKHFKFDNQTQIHIIQQIVDLAHQKFGLMITCSRRTPQAFQSALSDALAPYHNAYMWHGFGENPYIGMLAWADYLLLTNDSVSMTMEALQTGKPVYQIDLPIQERLFSRERLKTFNSQLQEAGLTRVFNGALTHYNYTPPQDLANCATYIQQHLLAE